MVDETIEAPIERQTRLLRFPGGTVNMDQPVEQAEAQALHDNKPLKLRIQPDLYSVDGGPNFKAWPGVVWHAEFASAGEVIEFRDALQAFIDGWFAAKGQE